MTTWKVSKYGVFSGPYFLALGKYFQKSTDKKELRIWTLLTQYLWKIFLTMIIFSNNLSRNFKRDVKRLHRNVSRIWSNIFSCSLIASFQIHDGACIHYSIHMIEQLCKYSFSGPVCIYLLKGYNRNTGRRCEICSKLTIKTPQKRHWRSSASIVTFEHVIAGWETFDRVSNQPPNYPLNEYCKNSCSRKLFCRIPILHPHPANSRKKWTWLY